MRNRAIAVWAGLFFFFAGLAVAQAPGYVSPNDLGVVVGLPKDGRGVRAGLAWGKELQPSARYSVAMDNLRYAMAGWTRVPFEVDAKVQLGSMTEHVDILFICSDRGFELTTQEKRNLKRYVEKGGFLVVDSNGESSALRRMIWELAGARTYVGGNAYNYFEPVPPDHPIYNTPFSMSEPPEGVTGTRIAANTHYLPDGRSVTVTGPPTLDGVFLDGRLVILYSTRGYVQTWVNSEKEDELKLGVNLIMYAMGMRY